MKIESVAVSELIPYALNGKNHPPEQVAMLAGIIREIGFRVPISIDEAGSIIAGHGRLLAAQKLGLTEVPCIRHKDLTPRQKRALRIADNRIAELARTNQENVTAELLDLAAGGDFNIELTGYTAKDVEALERAASEMGGEAGGRDESDKLKDSWQIIVECESESQQVRMLDRFEQEGLKCRALI